jgi:hypothetical protein
VQELAKEKKAGLLVENNRSRNQKLDLFKKKIKPKYQKTKA